MLQNKFVLSMMNNTVLKKLAFAKPVVTALNKITKN